MISFETIGIRLKVIAKALAHTKAFAIRAHALAYARHAKAFAQAQDKSKKNDSS